MTQAPTGTAMEYGQANTQRSGLRRWLGRAAAVGAMALAMLSGSQASGQGLTPGGPIDFGSQPVNGTLTTLTLTFSASVATTIQSVNALTLGVANKDFTVVSQTCTGSLAPPQSCNVNIGFVASTPGLRRGSLTLVDSTGTVVNQVFLHGIGLGAQVVTSPAYGTALTTLTGISPTAFQASAVAIDAAGTMFFNDYQFSRILKMTAAGTVSLVAPLATTANSSMALDGSGTLYVTSGALVYKLPVTGVPAVYSTGSITMSAPRGIAVDGTGYVYISDATLNDVVRVAPDGSSAVLTISGLSTPLSKPAGLTIDAANVLHIADTGNARVVNVGIYTNAATIKTIPLTSPVGVAVDGSNSVVVTDAAATRLVDSPSDTSNAYALGFGGASLSNPVNVAVKDNGDVVVADTASGLITLARNASQVTFATPTFVGHLDTETPTYTIQNSGNVALQFVVPAASTNASLDNAAFAFTSGSTCPQLTSSSTSGTANQLAQGAACSYALSFTPAVVGTNTAHATTMLTTVAAGTATFAPVTTITGTGLSNTTSLKVTATPSVTQPGSLVNLTVTAQTSAGAADAFYTGTVTLTTTDAAATFPGGASSYTFTAADAGTHTFAAPAGVIFNTLGTFTVKATDGTFTGTSNTVLVEKASGFTITATPSSINVGDSVSYTVTAIFSGATATGYTGTVNFSSTDASSTFLGPNSYTFTAADAGTHTFTAAQGVKFNTYGAFTIDATDGTASGTSNQILVGGITSIDFATVSNTARVGNPLGFTLTVKSGTTTATNFRGSVTFTSSDSTATFPAGTTYTFTAADAGVHTFTSPAAGVQFNQAGIFTASATNGAVTGTSQQIRVFGATSLQLVLSPTTTAAGSPVSLTITAFTGSDISTAYRGTVTFTSTDPAVAFLSGGSYTFTAADAGVHTFAAPAGVQFNTGGLQTVTATDPNNTGQALIGTSNTVNVTTTVASGFRVDTAANTVRVGNPLGLTITALNGSQVQTGFVGTITLTSTDPTATFPAGTTYTFTAADNGVHAFPSPNGIVFHQGGVYTISATSGTATGTSQQIRVFSATSLQLALSPTTTTAGTPVSMTVTAFTGTDISTAYRGTVTFTSTDPAVAFLSGTTYTFTAADAGVHTFTAPAGVKFNTAGQQTVTATDPNNTGQALAGTSNIVTVNAVSATSFAVATAANTSYVGQPLGFTVTAMNGNQVATGYVGTVTFTSTDPTATFPAGTTYTFTLADAGVHTFSSPNGIVFNQEGIFSLTATSGAATGTSQQIRVFSATGLTIALSPATTIAGSPVSMTVTATLNGSAVATAYRGTLTFSSTDPAVQFLGGTSYTFTAADAGTHTFTAVTAGAKFNTVGNQTVSITDGALSATSNVVAVTTNSGGGGGNTANGFTIVATPSSTTIGTPVSYTLTATQGGVTATGFTGTVTLTSTDSTATFLSGTTYTFTTADNGSHTFTVPTSGIKFNRAGTFTITATNGAASGTSNNVVVSAPSTATAFTLSASPSTTGIGAAVGLTISAVNSSGAIATDYIGTVTFSSSDPLVKFLGGTTYTFTAADAGTHTFAVASGVQFNTAGTQTANATDGAISGTSNGVIVVAADSFTIVATPTTTTADSPVSYTITAKLGGATATNFTGTVTLSSTDGLAKFLGGTTYTFTSADAGVHTFSGTSAIKFESTGVFTISATAGAISGTSNNVTVLAPASFSITVNPGSTTAGAPVSFTVSATSGGAVNTAYTGTVTFTSTDATAKFLSGTTYTFTNLDQGTHTFTAPSSGVTFNQGGTFTVSATDGTLNGTSNNVTVLSATGFTVTATPTTTSVGKTVTFTVTATNGTTTIPNFTGTITLSSTDSSATFLGGTSYTFTAADQGTHTFTAPIAGVAFNQTGTFTVTATSGALTGTSNGVVVTASGTGFTITATPTSTTVGSPVSFTITANTGSGVNTGYRGTVTFTATDPLAKFLSGTTYTFTAADNGTHTFTIANGVQFNQGGTYTISATDGSLSGTSNAVTVLAPTGFAIVATPSSTSIGTPVSFTITAVNVGTGGTTVIPNYTGTVTFSSTDNTAHFLSGVTYTFTAADKGTHSFPAPASGVTFNQGGTFTISATDGSTNGTSNNVVVNPIASAFTIVATPSTTSIGVPVSFTISAVNGSTVVTNYAGAVTFTTTDTTGKFLSGTSYTFTAADNGTHTFTAPVSGVQFNQAGSFTVTASDGTIRGTSNVVVVDPKATSFVIAVTPSTTTVGTPVSITVSAVNNGSVVANYTGTVTFSSTDAGAFFLSGTSYTFTAADNGVKTFTAPASGVKFSAPGTYTVGATDGTISGTSNNVVVNPVATGFTITATPTTTTVGTVISYTVTALNGASTATSYTGTVAFSSTDTGATFLSGTTYTFTAADNGVHTFTAPSSGVKFSKSGTFTISVTDGTNSATSTNILVNPIITGFTMVATPATTTVGTPISYTITAVNGTTPVTGYLGTVTFSSTDTGATFLSGTTYTFTAADAGTHTFTAPASGVKFSQAGTFTISATDGTFSGTSNNVLVNPNATGFTIVATPSTTTVGTPVSYTVMAVNGATTVTTYTGTVTFSSTDPGAAFLSGTTYTFTAADAGTHTFTAPASGVKFSKTGTFTIGATDGTITGTSNNVIVNPAATSFSIVATPSTTLVGSPVSYTITALNGTGTATAYTGAVTFTSTDATAKFLSGTSYTFTPADNGVKTFTAAAGVQFNTAGTFTISATDGTISGTSNNVLVNPLATAFTITATPSTTTVGTAVSYTITAVSGAAVSTGYTGTVTLTSTDNTVNFLSGTTLTFTAADNGTKTFTAPASGVQFNQAGTFTVSATDGKINGTSNNVIVNRVATAFTIVATPSTTNVGTAVSYTITAVNSGTAVPTYTGTVTLTSTDTTAKFLSGTTLTFTAADNGTKTFTAPASGIQFNAPGVFTVTGTDGTITGTSNSVTVIGPDAFTVTASPSITTIGVPVGFTVAATYKGAVVTNYVGTVSLSATDPLAKFLSGTSFTFTAAEQGVHVVTPANGVSFGTLGIFTINAASGTVTGVSNDVHVETVASVLLSSSANPVLTGTSFMLTATIPASNGATATGNVIFLDGGNQIGSAPLVNGVATLNNVSSTLLGTHSITASYAGDSNFLAATSAALAEIVEDFSIGIASGTSNSLTALGGHTATYQLALTPLGGPTFAAPITFTATGMPAGSVITFTPASLAAGVPATTVAFSVTPPVKVGALAKQGPGTELAHIAPWTALLVMLGLGAFGNRRKRLTRLLLFALAALPLTAMTGCLNSANDGYYGAAPTSYTVTITATSGSITHSTQVTLSTQ